MSFATVLSFCLYSEPSSSTLSFSLQFFLFILLSLPLSASASVSLLFFLFLLCLSSPLPFSIPFLSYLALFLSIPACAFFWAQLRGSLAVSVWAYWAPSSITRQTGLEQAQLSCGPTFSVACHLLFSAPLSPLPFLCLLSSYMQKRYFGIETERNRDVCD